MRAVQLTEHRRPLHVVDLPDPSPGPGDAVVRVAASGICRTDWHMWMRDWTWAGVDVTLPLVLGHEFGGVVEAVGADVVGVAVGDRVTVPFHEADGTCPSCLAGRQNLCDGLQTPGQTHDGGFAQYVRVPHASLNCIPLPDGVDDLSAATLGCRYQTAYHAVAFRARVRPGEWVLVVGCGGVGLSAIQVAVALGARVVAVDIDDVKLELARREGAETTLDARVDDLPAAVRDATDGGAHVSIEAVGLSASVRDAILSLRKFGRHVQLGLTSQEDRGMAQVPIDWITGFELEVYGNNGNAHPYYPALLDQVASGRLQPRRLVTREVGLGEVDGVLRSMTDYAPNGFTVVTDFA